MTNINIFKENDEFKAYAIRNDQVLKEIDKEQSLLDLKDYKLVKLYPEDRTKRLLDFACGKNGNKTFFNVFVDGGKLSANRKTLEYKGFKTRFLILGKENEKKKIYNTLWRHYVDLLNELKKEPLKLDKVEVAFNEISNSWDAKEKYFDDPLSKALYAFQKRYGYACVYYNMYAALLKELKDKYQNEKIKLHVLSIGCGNKTDAIGLQYALEDFDEFVSETKYVGIDAVDWNSDDTFAWLNEDDEFILLNEAPKGQNSATFYVSEEIKKIRSLGPEISQFGQGGDRLVCLVVFPNSISEIPQADVSRLMRTIKTTYGANETYILASRNLSTKLDRKQIATVKKETTSQIISYVTPSAYKDESIFCYNGWNKKTGFNNTYIFKQFSELNLASKGNRDEFKKKYEKLFIDEWKKKFGTGYEEEMYDALYADMFAIELEGKEFPMIDPDGNILKDEHGKDILISLRQDARTSLVRMPVMTRKYIHYDIFTL